MVKHVILWQLKEELSDAEKAAIKAGIKAGLEGLAGQIPGLVEIHVNISRGAQGLFHPPGPCCRGQQQGTPLL